MGTLAAQLAHQFPSSPAAPVALAHSLHRQYLASSRAPSSHQERGLIAQVTLAWHQSSSLPPQPHEGCQLRSLKAAYVMQMYEHGDCEEAGFTHAWLSKAEVQHAVRSFAAARDTAAAGLALLGSPDGGNVPASDSLRRELTLIHSSCLLELGDRAGAAEGFRGIAGTGTFASCLSTALQLSALRPLQDAMT